MDENGARLGSLRKFGHYRIPYINLCPVHYRICLLHTNGSPLSLRSPAFSSWRGNTYNFLLGINISNPVYPTIISIWNVEL